MSNIKLSENDRAQVRRLYASGWKPAKLAQKYRISTAYVHVLVRTGTGKCSTPNKGETREVAQRAMLSKYPRLAGWLAVHGKSQGDVKRDIDISFSRMVGFLYNRVPCEPDQRAAIVAYFGKNLAFVLGHTDALVELPKFTDPYLDVNIPISGWTDLLAQVEQNAAEEVSEGAAVTTPQPEP